MTIVKIKRAHCQAIMGVREFGIIVREHHCMLPRNHHGPHKGGGLIWGATAEEMMRAAEEDAHPIRKTIVLAK
jgi:hypothetical protein